MDLLSLKRQSSPQEFAQNLLKRGPVFFSEPEGFWVVTDHELAQQVLKSNDFSADRSSFFAARMSGCPFHKVANFFGVVRRMMVTSDPPEHTARRKLAASGIADQVLDLFQPNVERVVNERLTHVEPETVIDFVEKIALPLPNIVLADLFSIPHERRPDFYRWANDMTQFFGGASENMELDAENADTGAMQMREYFTELIRERRAQPKNDFFSHLLREQGSMEDEEIISQAAIMLVAGTITTTDQICNNLYTLLENGVWSDLVRQPDLLESALEEANRMDPAVNFVFRQIKRDQSLAGHALRTGQYVFVSTHAVNRNPGVFENPHRFDLGRKRNPHLSYGSGIHYCLGAKLGRIQMKTLFSRLLLSYPGLRFSEASPRRKHQSLGFSGFESFPLVMS